MSRPSAHITPTNDHDTGAATATAIGCCCRCCWLLLHCCGGTGSDTSCQLALHAHGCGAAHLQIAAGRIFQSGRHLTATITQASLFTPTPTHKGSTQYNITGSISPQRPLLLSTHNCDTQRQGHQYPCGCPWRRHLCHCLTFAITRPLRPAGHTYTGSAIAKANSRKGNERAEQGASTLTLHLARLQQACWCARRLALNVLDTTCRQTAWL
jgi:hypothetical protein